MEEIFAHIFSFWAPFYILQNLSLNTCSTNNKIRLSKITAFVISSKEEKCGSSKKKQFGNSWILKIKLRAVNLEYNLPCLRAQGYFQDKEKEYFGLNSQFETRLMKKNLNLYIWSISSAENLIAILEDLAKYQNNKIKILILKKLSKLPKSSL